MPRYGVTTAVAVVIGFVVAACGGAQAQRAARADLILLHGKIVTVDPADRVAQAMAVTAGKIVAVGSDQEIESRVGEGTRVIDLRGRTVTPGLIDSHAHFSAAAELYSVELSDVAITRMADILDRVAARVKGLKPGEWVQGRGWDEGKLVERRYVTAADLDKVSPVNPVWLTQTTNHYGVANTVALKLAGITRDTKDPPAGTIDRDSRGNPTGVLKESAQGLVARNVPPLTREQEKNGIIKIIQEFNREGMTAAKDPGIGQARWALYEERCGRGSSRCVSSRCGGSDRSTR